MKIAVCQLTSQTNPEKNLKTLRRLLTEVADKNISYVFLPECYYSLSNGRESTPYLVARGNEHYKEVQKLAQDFNVYLLGGSVAYENPGGLPFNRILNFQPNGMELDDYDKIHLFSCDLSRHQSQLKIDEADLYSAGKRPQMIQVEKLKLGLSLCFDLRFPEMFRQYSARGANALTIASSFTVPTGKVHWHPLLKARAIENQSFVIAAAQWGQNNERIQTYGHSLIVDPWGEVLVDAGEGEKVVYADLDFDRLEEVRSRLDVLQSE